MFHFICWSFVVDLAHSATAKKLVLWWSCQANAPGLLPSCRNGKLDFYELSLLLRQVLPELLPMEQHHVLSYLHAMDVNGDGELTFEELLAILRAVEASWNGRKFKRGFAG